MNTTEKNYLTTAVCYTDSHMWLTFFFTKEKRILKDFHKVINNNIKINFLYRYCLDNENNNEKIKRILAKTISRFACNPLFVPNSEKTKMFIERFIKYINNKYECIGTPISADLKPLRIESFNDIFGITFK